MKRNSKNSFSSLDLFSGSGFWQIPQGSPTLIAELRGLPHSLQGFKATIRSPKKGVLVEISHRSRFVVPATRKEVVKQFYPGDLITQFLSVIGGLND